MVFASGVATGIIGMLLLGVLMFLAFSQHLGTPGKDVAEVLAEHVGPLVAAIDRHGLALTRHGRSLVGHGMTINMHAEHLAQDLAKAAPVVEEVVQAAAPVVEAVAAELPKVI